MSDTPEGPTTTLSADAPGSPEKKTRLPQPPYIKLGEAVSIAKHIYEQGGGSADTTMLTKLVGNSSSSSSFGRKLQALRVYRLTSGMVPPITLTEIGTAIVAPRDEHQRLLNLKGAALGPEAFRTAYERYKGKLLPQDEFLLNAFEQDLNTTRVIAGFWLSSFKSALATAELLYLRPDGKTQVLELASATHVEAAPESATTAQAIVEQPQERQNEATTEAPISGHTTRVALSRGRFANIFIPDQLTAKEAARLKGALAGISAIVDSMIIDDAD